MALAPGTRLGPYEVLAQIGAGGMGEVYRARDTRLDRTVAIKVLPPETVTSPERRQRFVQEAKAASALNHPSIVTIYDIGQADSVDFIVMEHVDGRTLDKVIPRHGMRHNDVLRYAVQIADAMATAHEAGIVHRDLKPGNVIVTEKGVAKVLDFGVAKLTEPEPGGADEATRTITPGEPHTEEGTIVGTVSYMSPEQAQGLRVDARSDIFNFGAMLYEMVTGARAFRGDSEVSTLGAIIHTEPAPLAADVPHDLQRLIRRCLRKDPERRFQSMKEVKVELQELRDESDSGTLAAAAAPPSRPVVRWGMGAVLAAVAVVVAAGGWWWLGGPIPTGEQLAPTEVPLTSLPGQEMAPSFSPDGSEVAFSWEGDRQDNFDIYVQPVGAASRQRLTTDPAEDSAPAWSPGGGQIAFLREVGPQRRVVVLSSSRGGPERTLAEVEVPRARDVYTTLAWHPSGQHLAVTDAEGLFLLSAESGERRPLTAARPEDGYHVHPAFSPDGRTLAFAQWRNFSSDLYLLALDEATVPQGAPRRVNTGMNQATFPAWTADGQEILFRAWGPRGPAFWRMAVSATQAPRREIAFGRGGSHPAVSRDGRRLAYTNQATDVNIWQVEVPASTDAAPAPIRLIASTWTDTHMQFSPKGDRIAFQSNRSGTPEVWVCDRDGSNPFQVTHIGGGTAGTPRWSPDGQWIAYDARPEGHSDIFVVRADGGTPVALTSTPTEEFIPSWSRDGKWVYFESNRSGSGLNQVWKVPVEDGVATGDAVQVTRNGGTGAFESHDGAVLYYWKWPVVGRSETVEASLWQVPAAGGEETQIVEAVFPWFDSFAVAEDGIYFVSSDGVEVRFLDFRTRQIRPVVPFEQASFRHGSLDIFGRTLLFTQFDNVGSDLLLVENFR